MAFCSFTQNRRLWGALAASLAIAVPFGFSANPSVAQSAASQTMSAQPESSSQTKSTLNNLPSEERNALRRGEVLVSGENGEFFGQVLVNASIEDAWEVLTDYDNFENFLPNIESSDLIDSEGERNIFEQVNVIEVLPFVTTRSRVKIESIESYPQAVDFSLVDGDLEALNGVWRLEPVAGSRDQVLVTHQVSVDPGNGSPRGIFFSTYKTILEDSLTAARQEAETRAGRRAAM